MLKFTFADLFKFLILSHVLAVCRAVNLPLLSPGISSDSANVSTYLSPASGSLPTQDPFRGQCFSPTHRPSFIHSLLRQVSFPSCRRVIRFLLDHPQADEYLYWDEESKFGTRNCHVDFMPPTIQGKKRDLRFTRRQVGEIITRTLIACQAHPGKPGIGGYGGELHWVVTTGNGRG